jgi:hypothetical protein
VHPGDDFSSPRGRASAEASPNAGRRFAPGRKTPGFGFVEHLSMHAQGWKALFRRKAVKALTSSKWSQGRFQPAESILERL